jgi:hypothetical protein
MKITRNPRGGRGTISGPAASDSAGVFFRRPILSAWDNSLFPTLVWTQRPTAEPSASAVLAFLAAAAAPAAVELLLPMDLGRSKDCRNGGEEVELREQCARKKTVAAEWDELFTLPPLFIPPLGINVRSQPSMAKRKRPG